MSAESPFSSFQAPVTAIRLYRQVAKVVTRILDPKRNSSPPASRSDFSLNGHGRMSLEDVITEVQEKVIAHAVNGRHVQSVAHMVPPPPMVSVVADTLIGAMNQCAFIWEEAPVAADIETETIRWLNQIIGYSPNAFGLLTSGGTTSNLLAAYLALCQAKERSPSATSDRYCLIASDQAHFSVDKAAAILGLGREAVVRVATDHLGKLQPGEILHATDQALAAGRIPFLFICTAGTTNSGAVEPTGEFLQAAHYCNAWCHVDAAHGGALRLCNALPEKTALWAQADSISWDPHKGLYVSYAVGALLLKEHSARRHLEFHSEYAIKQNEDELDAGKWHFEGSRRFEALKLWMAIKHFGIDGYRELTAHCLWLAQECGACIHATADLQLLCEPDANIICFRFCDPTLNEEELNALNGGIQKALFKSGSPLVSSTRIKGRVWLRAVFLNPNLQSKHLADIVEAIRHEALAQVACVQQSKDGYNENFPRYKPSPEPQRVSPTT
ncbi:MAG: pyridoxal-dependent decarboxylase [Rhodospirillales bacterium]|nr:pyridoxal-dependent decarboxylase [Rhodospirillales bacterium]